MTAAITEGVQVLDLPDAEYHRHEALSQTTAKRLLPPSCPALAKWQHENPETKNYFDFGHVVHTGILGTGMQPEIVLDEDGEPYDNWRTKRSGTEADRIRAAGGVPMLAKDLHRAQVVIGEVLSDPIAGKLLEPGSFDAEMAIVWRDDATGVKRRMKFDALRGGWGRGPLVVVDVKSTPSCATRALQKVIADYGYYQQDPWYRDGVQAWIDERPAFVFVFVEQKPPHLVRVVQLDDEAVMTGAERNARAIRVWAKCVENDRWPGYSDDIDDISLPQWAKV